MKAETIKNDYIVRIYVNSTRKAFKQKRFKSLESAQKFVQGKCGGKNYEQYFNLG